MPPTRVPWKTSLSTRFSIEAGAGLVCRLVKGMQEIWTVCAPFLDRWIISRTLRSCHGQPLKTRVDRITKRCASPSWCRRRGTKRANRTSCKQVSNSQHWTTRTDKTQQNRSPQKLTKNSIATATSNLQYQTSKQISTQSLTYAIRWTQQWATSMSHPGLICSTTTIKSVSTVC